MYDNLRQVFGTFQSGTRNVVKLGFSKNVDVVYVILKSYLAFTFEEFNEIHRREKM